MTMAAMAPCRIRSWRPSDIAIPLSMGRQKLKLSLGGIVPRAGHNVARVLAKMFFKFFLREVTQIDVLFWEVNVALCVCVCACVLRV